MIIECELGIYFIYTDIVLLFPFFIQNYGSLDSIKPSELILEKDRNVPDATIVSEIDCTMKKHVDSLLHVLEGVSEKLTQLESRTRHLENSVDDLKISVGNNHGNTDGKMRQLENVLRDVCCLFALLFGVSLTSCLAFGILAIR